MDDDVQAADNELIACNLGEREMAIRSEVLAGELFPGVEAVEELADGYGYRFPGDEEWTARVLDFVAAERRCCPFFRFEVVFEPHDGPLWLRLRGSEAIKGFVSDQLHAVRSVPLVMPSEVETSDLSRRGDPATADANYSTSSE